MHLVSEAIENYIEKHSTAEDTLLAELNRETYVKVQMPQMLSGHLQGQFLEMFSRLLHPKRVLEIGTFTGYSGLCLAKGLTEDGLLYTLDINEELQPMVERYIAKAGMTKKIKQLIGNAVEIIPTLNETFDLVFIDADKANYCNYYNLVFDKVRTGGYIVTDNVLWSGKVLDEKKDKDTLNIDNYNKKVAGDARVDSYVLPLRDGISIARKL